MYCETLINVWWEVLFKLLFLKCVAARLCLVGLALTQKK